MSGLNGALSSAASNTVTIPAGKAGVMLCFGAQGGGGVTNPNGTPTWNSGGGGTVAINGTVIAFVGGAALLAVYVASGASQGIPEFAAGPAQIGPFRLNAGDVVSCTSGSLGYTIDLEDV